MIWQCYVIMIEEEKEKAIAVVTLEVIDNARCHVACRRSKRHATWKRFKPALVRLVIQQDTYTYTRRPPESICILFLRFCHSWKIKTPGSYLSRLFVPLDRYQPGERRVIKAGVRSLFQCRAERVWPTTATHPLPLFCKS